MADRNFFEVAAVSVALRFGGKLLFFWEEVALLDQFHLQLGKSHVGTHQQLLNKMLTLAQVQNADLKQFHGCHHNTCHNTSTMHRRARLDVLAEQRLRVVELALSLEQPRHVADRGERVRMAIPERRAARLEVLSSCAKKMKKNKIARKGLITPHTTSRMRWRLRA